MRRRQPPCRRWIRGRPRTGADGGPEPLPDAGLDAGIPLQASRFFPTSGAAALTGVRRLSDGSVIVQGYFEGGSADLSGELLLNPGAEEGVPDADLFVARFDPAGAHVWSRKLGVPGGVVLPTSLAVSAEGEVLFSARSSLPVTVNGLELPAGGLVARLSADGAWQWAVPFAQNAEAVAFTADGGAVSVGDTGEELTVLRLRPDGEPLWERRFVSKGAVSGTSVAVDALGNVLLGGNYRGELSLGAHALPRATGSPFVASLDGEGTPQWARGLPAADLGGDAPGASVTSVVPTGDGGLVACGFFREWLSAEGPPSTPPGLYQGFVLATDAKGETRWLRWFSASRGVMARAVATDGRGTFVLAGTFAGEMTVDGQTLSTVAAGEGLFVFELGLESPSIVRARTFSNGRYIWLKAVALDDSTVTIAGLGSGALEVGGSTLAGGTEDPLLIVLPR